MPDPRPLEGTRRRWTITRAWKRLDSLSPRELVQVVVGPDAEVVEVMPSLPPGVWVVGQDGEAREIEDDG